MERRDKMKPVNNDNSTMRGGGSEGGINGVYNYGYNDGDDDQHKETPQHYLATNVNKRTTTTTTTSNLQSNQEQIIVQDSGSDGGGGGGGNNMIQQQQECSDLMYKIDDTPPWHISALLGLQHFLIMIGATISIPYILAPFFCIDETNPVRGKLLCTILFVSGLVTIIQSTFGIRLPIIQGGTFSFFVPTIAILTTNFEPCKDATQHNLTEAQIEEEWQVRMREIQGAIAVSGVVQVIIGFTGVIGLLLTWITPLTIVPTVTLVGLTLFSIAADKASLHWGISFMTMFLLILFSQYLKDVRIPCPNYNREKGGFTISWVYIFKLFPVLLAVGMSWGLCAILTVTQVLPEDSKARTDLNTHIIKESPWFRLPYPGQWGMPTVSVAGALGMLAGVIASMIESIGDYYACARISGAPPPPVHAINRGIGIEGIGCILAALWGSGNGTTSYSENIGAIGVTKVGSRRVIQVAGLIMMLFGVIGKCGSAMVTIPEPIVGGMFIVMFSIITAVGLSNLQFVNLSSSRNIFIVGFSIFFGLALPKWVQSNSESIQTGSETFDQIVIVLLQTSMLVGGILGFVLDNTIPGSPEERGIVAWNNQTTTLLSSPSHNDEIKSTCYDIPYVMPTLLKNRMSWTTHLPFCPNFSGFCRRKEKPEV